MAKDAWTDPCRYKRSKLSGTAYVESSAHWREKKRLVRKGFFGQLFKCLFWRTQAAEESHIDHTQQLCCAPKPGGRRFGRRSGGASLNSAGDPAFGYIFRIYENRRSS